MNKLILATLFALCTSPTFSMDTEDRELLSEQVVKYFKRVSAETHVPVSLKITLTDTYNDKEITEDEKSLSSTELPAYISKQFLIDISDALRELLPGFSRDITPERLMLNVTIWVPAAGHKEKVNGFCSLK